MADTRIILRIDVARRKRLRGLARSRGVSESQVVREAIDQHIEASADESAFDRLKRAKSIGVVGGTPADLSTNREHFDGLGK